MTLAQLSSFEPRTPELRIQDLNHLATARLDLPISFLYLSKPRLISVINGQQQSNLFFIHQAIENATPIFEQLSKAKVFY